MPSGTSAEGLRQPRSDRLRIDGAGPCHCDKPAMAHGPTFPATGAPTGSARRADHLAGDQSSTVQHPTNRTSCSSLARARSSDGTGIRFCRSNSTLVTSGCPVAQVVARLGAPGILFMLPLASSSNSSSGHSARQPSAPGVRYPCLESGHACATQDHPTLGIERAGEVPTNLKLGVTAAFVPTHHGARPPGPPLHATLWVATPTRQQSPFALTLTEVASRRGRAASGSRRVGARRRSATSRSSTKARLGEGVGS